MYTQYIKENNILNTSMGKTFLQPYVPLLQCKKLLNNNSYNFSFLTVRGKCDFLTSTAPYLHKRVLWKSAGAEIDQSQTVPLCVTALYSSLCSVKINIWLFDCAIHRFYFTALALNVLFTTDNFQTTSACSAAFGLQLFKTLPAS